MKCVCLSEQTFDGLILKFGDGFAESPFVYYLIHISQGYQLIDYPSTLLPVPVDRHLYANR